MNVWGNILLLRWTGFVFLNYFHFREGESRQSQNFWIKLFNVLINTGAKEEGRSKWSRGVESSNTYRCLEKIRIWYEISRYLIKITE